MGHISAKLSEGLATRRVARLLDWVLAPDWLTVEPVCFLSGWDVASMLAIMDAGGVDLNDDGLIAKDSLEDFQEACALLLHWDD